VSKLKSGFSTRLAVSDMLEGLFKISLYLPNKPLTASFSKLLKSGLATKTASYSSSTLKNPCSKTFFTSYLFSSWSLLSGTSIKTTKQ
jgi:hypothetical protein